MAPAVAPAGRAVVFGGELRVQGEAEGDDVRGVGPEGEEAAGFAGCAAGDFRGFEERDVVLGRVVGGVAGEVVC